MMLEDLKLYQFSFPFVIVIGSSRTIFVLSLGKLNARKFPVSVAFVVSESLNLTATELSPLFKSLPDKIAN